MKKYKVLLSIVLTFIIFVPTFNISAEEFAVEEQMVIVSEPITEEDAQDEIVTPEEEVVEDEIEEIIEEDEEEIIEEEEITLKESFFMRSGDTVIYSGDIDLPEEGMIEIVDSNGNLHQVNARSVLGVLYNLDQASDAFTISNLQYYDSFSSFYLKCITVGEMEPLCDSWQYVVGGFSPWTSIDTTMLTGGEFINLYFGNPYRIELSSNTINISESIIAKAQSYNYTDNTWITRTGVSVGITKTNPDNAWNPIIVSTHPVNDNGEATLTFVEAGTYNVGISEDYYFPSYEVTVSAPSSGGGGGSTTKTFSVDNALSYLISKQNTDGSFGDALYTDWVAIALSSAGNRANSAKERVAEYMKNNPMNSTMLTDNERHAMAMMALDINPYNGTSINYIEKIISSFDGNQFGDTSIINDDIFALIVLKNAGYSKNDEIIEKSISYLISKQSNDGSWENMDTTSAGIMALRNFKNMSGLEDAITKAENYLVGKQGSDGSFGNSYGTSWALQALSANYSLNAEVAKGDSYMALAQQTDGGMEQVTDNINNRIWATSYAIPGALHLSWNDIMSSFDKEGEEKEEEGGSDKVEPIKEEMKDIIVLATEVEKPEVEEIVAPKSIKKIIENKVAIVETQPEEMEEQDINILTANAGDVVPDTNKLLEILKVIWNLILSPFVSLWLKLGFLV